MHGSRSATLDDASRRGPSLRSWQSRRYWDEIFAQEDPWRYDESDYFRWKTELTLGLLSAFPAQTALEIGCGEGHFTSRLADHVGSLTAIDLSPRALSRARERCGGRDAVKFAVMDLAKDPLPRGMELIVCNEVLYYLPLDVVRSQAGRILSCLQPGGHLVLAHANMAIDDPEATGFDIGATFGAKTIGDVFAAVEGSDRVRRLRTPLFTLEVFRRTDGSNARPAPPAEQDVLLPSGVRLSASEARSFLWQGERRAPSESEAPVAAPSAPILMYHSIADDGPQSLAPYRVSPAAFAEQMAFLKRENFHCMTIAQWLGCLNGDPPPHERSVILTFDDGYRDFFENAWPVLERNGFTATVFVVTGKAGGVADWDEHGEAPLPLMSWDQLRILSAKGVEIGGHSTSHWDLTTVSMRDVARDGEKAREDLQRELGLDVTIMAYPWGRRDADVGMMLAGVGYRAAVTTYGGRSRPGDDLMSLPRIEVFGNDSLAEFAAKVLDASELADTETADDELAAEAPVASSAEVVSFEERPWLQTDDTFDEFVDFLEPVAESPDVAAPFEGPRPPDSPGEAVFNDHGSDDDPPASSLSTPVSPKALHPEFVRGLSARLDRLIGEFVQMQSDLLAACGSALPLQQKIQGMFNQPTTGRVTRPITPSMMLAPEVRLHIDEDVDAWLTVEPKSDHAASPDSFLNVVTLDIRAPTSLLAIAVSLEWADVSQANAYQLNLYAHAERRVAGYAELLFPCRDGSQRRFGLKPFDIGADQRAVVSTGDFRLPDFIDIDERARPEIRLHFDASAPLSLTLDYMNLYFA
jgi:peptidoglycan/xylan/chitin deacetylase (PgdA/CDA1 family)/2-polyprenyl-3-methyl-5-hydroxy-6-metoxy-1,4-benzoquinol methylase